ncbi:PucR family transcriptional regulator [Nocardia wallacei]|uniref:Putative transcriptional regulator n=1 Tax=Nocardia wallacei TaxID=480035 RepID=A0A7G1KKR1_9NOCA|nr:PucR family transcriptional regulator [Nocardia wallacei]BCK55431.1 putative transcriptional regulator [Nocardia wallacei]
MESPTRDRALEALYRRAGVLMREFSASIPPYRSIPRSLVMPGWERGATLNIELFFDFLQRGEEPGEEATRELVELAVGRVRDGEPLEEVLGRYREGAEFLYDRLCAATAGAERELLAEAALPLLRYVTLVVERIAAACVRRAHDPRWELLERRRTLADALLTGRDPAQWADEPVLAVPEGFLVAVFRLGTGGRAGSGPAELRHRIESIPGVLLRLDSGGWTALVPLRAGDDGSAAIAHLSGRLPPRTAAHAPRFWVGVGAAHGRSAVPAVFAEARALAELGRCLDRPESVCRRENLQFEYMVAAGAAARPGLATILAPLDEQPLLAETLETFVDSGFNQLATARQLNIHRNTVTYRLARVHELTGLDPHRPTDAMTLSAARIARKLESAAFAP